MMKKYRFGKGNFRNLTEGIEREWLIANGIGGFANASITNNNSRMHSAYLVAALNPPVDRINVLTKISEQINVDKIIYDLDSQQFVGKEENAGYKKLEAFEFDIVPKFIYQFQDVRMVKTIAMDYGHNTVSVCYRVWNGLSKINISLVPEFALRDNNVANEKEDAIDAAWDVDNGRCILTNNKDDRYKVYFTYSEGDVKERDKDDVLVKDKFVAIDSRNGFEGSDTTYSPFTVDVDIMPGEYREFYVVCSLEDDVEKSGFEIEEEYIKRGKALAGVMPDDFSARLAISADTFIVNRDSTKLKTILAGFPWFTDWGRDTMIALQGLGLCTKRYDDTRQILLSFSKYLKDGLIPNMFPSYASEEPIYNTVDASLWYFYSVFKYLEYTGEEQDYEFIKENIYPTLQAIVKAYKEGTKFSIGMKEDGLVSAGSDFDQVTWMDVRVGEWVVTPRHGKPVEINALWYNALRIMEGLSEKFGDNPQEYKELADKVYVSFNARFWNDKKKCLYDVVDVDDDRIRPNQIWAVSLPFSLLTREKEQMIVDCVYKHLYTAYGLRSLSYTDLEYKPSYIGKLHDRDGAYHMGTSWAFPMGGYITAYMKVNGYSKEAAHRAMEMLEAFDDHMHDGCINGIAEVFSGTNTCTGNGCYNQAWSVGEILRAYIEDVRDYL